MTSTSGDAWPELLAMIEAAPVSSLISVGGSIADLSALGLTRRSYLGAIVANTAGITLDEGWLRLLGGAGGDLPSLAQVNASSVGLCIIGFDVMGGVFALDGGGLGAGDASVHYFAPDTSSWESLGTSHSGFLTAMLHGSMAPFYEPFRWAGWQAEVNELAPDQGLSLYPPLSTVEGKDPSASSRRPAPLAEVAAPFWPRPPA